MARTRRRVNRVVLLALLAVCAWPWGGTRAEAVPSAGSGPREADREEVPPPLGWQEPSPVTRLYLQLPFEAPEPLVPGRVEAEVRLLYSNNLLDLRRPGVTLYTDVETAQPTLQLSGGLGHGLELRCALPVVADWGGLLDRPIEIIEGLFHAANPQRQQHPRDQATWLLVRDDGRGFTRHGAGVGLGDAWVGLKAALLEEAGAVPAVSARLALSLPTGRLPWGAGAVVPGAGLLVGWRGRAIALRLSLDFMVPPARLRVVQLQTRPYGAANLGLTMPASGGLALQAQASAHAPPFYNTGLDRIDKPTFYALLGISQRLVSGAVVDLGLVENIFSPDRGADFTIVLAVRSP
jgi:hypothetical protein